MKNQILTRISRRGFAQSHSASDFLDLAPRGTINVTLSTLAKEGKLRRLQRGLYDLPKVNPELGGRLRPDIDKAAQTLARNYNWKIIPEGKWAANLLGLSTQVPSKIVYLSDGPTKSVLIGRRTLYFKHARPKALAGTGKTALAIQALRSIGKARVNDTHLAQLSSVLSATDKKKFLRAARLSMDWIHEVAKKITGEPA